MKAEIIICHRCQKTIPGATRNSHFTSGFYDVRGVTWGKYRRPGESVVCDDCMHKDPKYRKDYGM